MIETPKKTGCVFSFVVIFISFLLYFILSYHYYPGLKFVISGYSEKDVRGTVYWNLGYGFNQYDKKEIILKTPLINQKIGEVVVSPTGQKDSKARGNWTWLNINRNESGKSFRVEGKHLWKGGWILGLPPGSKIIFKSDKPKIKINFFPSRYGGYVKITSSRGIPQIINLYDLNPHGISYPFIYRLCQPGKFRLKVNLPRHKIYGIKFIPYKAELFKPIDLNNNIGEDSRAYKDALFEKIDFKIDEVFIYNELKERKEISGSEVNKNTGHIVCENIELKQTAFRKLLFSVQISTAGILTFLLYWFTNLSFWAKCDDIKGIIQKLFLRNRIWLFWIFFIAQITMNTFWLIAEWPGALTPDPVWIMRNLKVLAITNHHPYGYSLFVLGLLNIFDSHLTVIVFQILSFSLIASLFFYRIYRMGLGIYWVFIFFIMMLLSIPINLFNITMWKDVPFSNLTVFWGLFVGYTWYIKKYEDRNIVLSSQDLYFLGGVFFSLCVFRHNGIIYLPLIPLLLFLGKGIERNSLLKMLMINIIFLLLYFFVLPQYILVDRPIENKMATNILGRKIEKALHILDLKKHYYLEDYLAERVNKFIATLGTSPEATTWYNDLDHPPQRWFSNDQLRGKIILEKSPLIFKKISKYLLSTREYKGVTGGRFLFWNSLFSLIILIIAFVLYKWIPISAVFSSIMLYQAACLFFVVWPRWRYMYFIYLSGYFLLPIIILELKTMKSRMAITS